MKKAYLNWSSGKDAALALYLLRQANKFNIEKLVTTLNTEVNRISMHGVRRELLEKQALEMDLPLHTISLPGEVSMQQYNRILEQETDLLKKEGFTHSVFGDIFLEDLRKYREAELKKVGLEAVFPLWKMNSLDLMKQFLAAGFKAVTVCVNSKVLGSSFCGRMVDEKFLAELPEGVDPCGENGEFHTFVFDGPIFNNPIKFKVGEVVEKFYTPSKEKDDCFKDPKAWDTGFWYCDLIPKNS